MVRVTILTEGATLTAANLPLHIEQGATKTFGLVWSHGDSVDDATPYDLTGCTARMQIRNKVNTPVLLEATTENGDITLGADGVIAVKLSDEKTDLLTVTKAVYDLEVEFPGGDVARVVEGQVTISPNVTRAG